MSKSKPHSESAKAPKFIGRGASINPANRFEPIHVEAEYDQLDPDDQMSALRQKTPTEYFLDQSESVVSENNSPDLKFRYSINPYRGCAHGCSYCYARPYHEFLGLSAGLDFETKIFAKPDAPDLFRRWLSRKNWQCEPVNLSGITDPYQPAERKFEITRGCLQVALECQQPIFLITKNALVIRDLDLLEKLAANRLVGVIISITSLDQKLVRLMEPRTSVPESRLRTVSELAKRNINVLVNVSPIIPGLTDSEIPEILRQSKQAGAHAASYTIVRLPGAVEQIFLDWLQSNYPNQKSKVAAYVKAMREGQLSDSRFFHRMKGSGVLAEHIRSTFKTFARKFGLDNNLPHLDASRFQPPQQDTDQRLLFD